MKGKHTWFKYRQCVLEMVREIDAYDSYVHTSVPLKSFINGLTGITAETLKDALQWRKL